ncbi:MAG TPA: hypothetical protein VJA47_03990 [archaeon]|nr:hypothetical protein [archaeon]
MAEIYIFKITRADIERVDSGVRIRLWYPTTPEVTNKRLPRNPEWGAQVFDRLLREGYTTLADQNNPIRPCSGGSAYLFDDDVLLFHRRDVRAPTHPLYHSIAGGFPKNKGEVTTEDGLISCSLRETAEENILLTKGSQRLLVPKGSESHTLESASRLGLADLPQIQIETERIDPPDVLEAYTEDGSLLFSTRAFLDCIFDSEAGLTALQILRMKGVTSTDVLPVDGEYMITDGKPIFFDRECYLSTLEDLNSKPFGDAIQNPLVYRQEWIPSTSGRIVVPRQQTISDYKPPHLGPDKIPADYPHIFGPDDMLVRVLDGLGVEGYKGGWIKMQLEKERKAVAIKG